MNIKFGVNTLVWVLSFTENDFELIDTISGMGFDVIELTPGSEFAKLKPDRLRKKLGEAGLEASICSALDETQDFSSADESVRRNGVAYMRDLSAWAKEIGAHVIGGPLYSELGKKRYLSPEERKAEWDRSAETLRMVGDEVAENGVTVALEPINRFEIDLINTAEQAFRMCEQVGHPAVGMMLDTFHMNIEDKKLGDAIRASKKHLVHFHTCSNDRGVPGQGHIPWDEVKKALKDIDYSGYGVIESFAQGQVAAFANIWRPLVQDQNDIPREGVRFLKSLFA